MFQQYFLNVLVVPPLLLLQICIVTKTLSVFESIVKFLDERYGIEEINESLFDVLLQKRLMSVEASRKKYHARKLAGESCSKMMEKL